MLLAFSLCCGLVSPAFATCDQVLATGSAYKNYEAVWQQVKAGAEPATVKNIGCFVDISGGLDAEAAYRRLIATTFQPNILYDYLVEEERSVLRKARTDAGGPSAALAWRGGYLAEAAMTAYERTNDRRFLDFFVNYFDKVLTFRDSERGVTDVYHGRIMASWGEYRPAWVWLGPIPIKMNLWVAHVTHAARITLAASEFIRVVMSDPALADYQPAAQRYLDASLAALGEFDEDRTPIGDTEDTWYTRPVTGAPEATNHLHTLGSVYINLASVTGDQTMKQRVNDLVSVFEEGVQTADDGTVYWQYFPYFADQSIGPNGREFSERLWKASQTAPFLYRAYAAGYAVPETLIKAVVATFLTHIVRDGQVLRNVSPIDSAPIQPDDKDLSHLGGIVTWLEFSAYEPAIADRIVNLVGARPDLFPGGWFDSSDMARGYAFLLGRTGDPVAAKPTPVASPAHRAGKPPS
jgi:hypothetical protein